MVTFHSQARTPRMPLKLSLKPGEKFVLNGAVLTNGDKRTSLVIQNKACVLREKDIMQPKDAKTPARLVYLAIMMMYLDRKSTRLNSSHLGISYAVFCLKKQRTHMHWRVRSSGVCRRTDSAHVSDGR